MTSRKLFIFVLCLVLILSSHVLSDEPYSELAIGSRAFSLGQIASVSYSDALSSINNPASLAHANNISSSLYYAEPFLDTKSLGIGITLPTDYNGTFGFSYFYFLIDDIIARDASQNNAGTYSWSQKEFVISYGNVIYDKFIIGLNAKLINDGFNFSYRSPMLNDHVSFDASVGVLPKIKNIWLKNFGIGLVLKNLIQFNDSNAYIPRATNLIAENGYYFSNQSIFVVMNYSWFEDVLKIYQERFHVGAEYCYQLLCFRIGYSNGYSHERISFGSGIRYNFLKIDYGYGDYINNNMFGRPIHNVTLGFVF